MNPLKYPKLRNWLLAAAVVGGLRPAAFPTDGYFVQGFGAVNSALGGAATAGNAEDLIGSIYKNPANGILFSDRTASVAFGDILPTATIGSSVVIPAYGINLNGSSSSTVDEVPYLSLMANWRTKDASLAWFAGVVSEAGLSFHVPQSMTNPVFMPQPGAPNNPFGGLLGGFGDVRTSLYVIRIPIGLSAALAEGWSWGIALAPSVGDMLFTPAVFAAPNVSTGAAYYPIVQNHDMQLGLGAQAGLRYQLGSDVSYGLSLSTPTWFESYKWTARDQFGNPHTAVMHMDRPLTAQLGGGFAVTPTTTVLADFGFIAYGETRGFDKSGFRLDGSAQGLGWRDSETVEIGIQQAVGGGYVLRVGYNYCSDPIPTSMTFYNVASPLHMSSQVSVGLSFPIGGGATIDAAFTHGFSHTQSSTWYNPAGAVPGTYLTSTIGGNEFDIGSTFKF